MKFAAACALALLCAKASAVAQSGSVTSSRAPAQVAGCYTLTLGKWSAPFPSRFDAGHIPPDTIQLDTTLLEGSEGRRGVRKAAPHIPALTGRYKRPPLWMFSGGDSIRITWGNGLAGVHVNVAVRDDSLTGYAQSFWDVIGPTEPTAPVLLRRSSCRLVPANTLLDLLWRIEALRPVPIVTSSSAVQRRGTLYGDKAMRLMPTERFDMIEIGLEGGCTIRARGARIELASCPWLPGFRDAQGDVFRVIGRYPPS